MELRNPLMNASGILGLTAGSLLRVAEAGAGLVVTKSMGLEARHGYPNPTVVEVEAGLLNALGLPNPGLTPYLEELKEALGSLKVPVVASIYGFSPREYGELAGRLDGSGINALELNVSCPHVGEVGVEIGQRPEVLAKAVAEAKNSTKLPVIVKLTPNVADIGGLARVAEEAGADAVTAINTVKGLAIDFETGWPRLGAGFGGLSGPAIKPIALRCVYEVFEAVEIPIIGCGGISNWKDAVEFLMAGASALQIGTAIVHRDLGVFGEVEGGLREYLERKGFRSPSDLIGLTHTKLRDLP